MKVEIDIDELTRLKTDLEDTKTELQEWKQKVIDLDEDKLKKKAVDLSLRLFNEYMAAVFKTLGFEGGWHSESVRFDLDHKNELGKAWWSSDRLKIDVCAIVRNNFRSAFLAIGVLPKEESKENDPFAL